MGQEFQKLVEELKKEEIELIKNYNHKTLEEGYFFKNKKTGKECYWSLSYKKKHLHLYLRKLGKNNMTNEEISVIASLLFQYIRERENKGEELLIISTERYVVNLENIDSELRPLDEVEGLLFRKMRIYKHEGMYRYYLRKEIETVYTEAEIYKKINHFFKKLKQKDPTFYIEGEIGRSITVIFYWKGVRYSLDIDYILQKHTITINRTKEEIKVKTLKDLSVLEEKLEKLFDRLYKKNRLEVIYEESTYHFDSITSKLKLSENMKKNWKNEVLKDLKQKDLEVAIGKTDHLYFILSNVGIFPLEEKYWVFEFEKGTIESFDNEEEAYKKAETYYLERKKEDMKELYQKTL